MKIDDTKKEILEANSKVCRDMIDGAKKGILEATNICTDTEKKLPNKFKKKFSSGTMSINEKVTGGIIKIKILTKNIKPQNP